MKKDFFKEKNFIIWSAIVFIGILSDQLSKFWARKHLLPFESVEIISDFLHFKLLFNTGAAFSFLSGKTYILLFISLIVSILIVKYTFQKINTLKKPEIISLAFLLAGSMGNLIDRILFGKVTDFIDLLILPGNFPIFNLADIWINLAVFIFIMNWLYSEYFDNKKPSLL